MRVGWALGVLAWALVATPARADKMAETLDISVGTRASWVQLHRALEAAPGTDAPDLVRRAQPHLHGEGALTGAFARFGATLEGVRAGVGVGVLGPTPLALLHAPVEGGWIEPGSVWGAPFEGYLGYTFGDPDDLRILVEARGALTVLQTRIHAFHETLGDLGTIPMNVYLPNLELVVGVRVPIDSWLFLEGGVGVSPLPSELSPERGSVFFSVGIPVPTANAF